ncbi:ATP-dependent RNA helicase SrmB [Vibrio stylophorae]|uniref:ATP-dependent RNA helicase SrmB n=1 Tax=Vibrio stylophorae TaxID=659351 RepID=A0ABN8DPI4_9VIBR|nr:ATP-dependent RNA helicase SrmB [Vibrio stylophorae]CAH0532670.1 ATP-dependent RNA helicase SrmB [Vibrio stylophorae]
MRDFASLELDESLLEAIELLNYSRPTEIQSLAIPPALDGQDIMASAPTGTGKTAAFALPMIQHLLDFPRSKPGPARVLILTPTRELAIQVADTVRNLAQFTKLKVITVTGGISYEDHAEWLGKPQDIVVATPGRLMEYIEAERFDCRAIECFVLDEADRMLDMGFAGIVHRIVGECRWRKQSLLFSATLEGKGVRDFAQELLGEATVIDAEPSRRERKKINQWYYRADDMEHKWALTQHIVQEIAEKTIIFIKTRERLAELRSRFDQAGIRTAWLQGEMAQAKRSNSIERFAKGDVKILLATDVAARGIDLPDVTHVINYDMPRTADVFLHRIGRTARAGKKGSAIAIVEAHDQPMIERVMRYLDEPIKERFIEGLKPKHKKPAFVKKKKKKDGDSKGKSKSKDGKKKTKTVKKVRKDKGKPKTQSSEA